MSWKCQKCSAENPDPGAGEHLLLRIKTAVGKSVCKKLGPDSQFWAEPQFTCEPASDGWRIIPNTEAPNETQLNGRAITSPQIVGTGDILSVGKESKGIIKLPLQVNYGKEGDCLGCHYSPFLMLNSVSMEQVNWRLAVIQDEASHPEETDNDLAADIVFLVDLTQGMQPALEALKRNIGNCVDSLCDKTNNPRGDWRAKVAGYRDVTDDTAPPLEDNPFVHNDGDALKAQLQALQTQGEDKGPSSLLDAIMHVANKGQTDKDAKELDPNKWRYRSSAHRVVIIFTDADYHPTTKDGGTFEDIVNNCHSQRLCLNIFAPEMDSYDQLNEIDKSEYEAIEVQSGEEPADALARFAGDLDIYEMIFKYMFREDTVFKVYNAIREHGFTSISSLAEQTGLSDHLLAYGLENCFWYGVLAHDPGGVKVLNRRLDNKYFMGMYVESVLVDEETFQMWQKISYK